MPPQPEPSHRTVHQDCFLHIRLPNSDTLFLRDEQFTFLDVESFVPLVNLGECTVNTDQIWRVDILIEEHVHILLAVVACPHTSPTKEETLIGSQAVDDAVVARVVECLQGHMDATIVADVLTQQFWDILHYSVTDGIKNYEKCFAESRKECIFATRKFMFSD